MAQAPTTVGYAGAPGTPVRHGRFGASYRGHPSPDLGRRHILSDRGRSEDDLISRGSTRCLLDCRPSRSRRDVVSMMPCSRLSPVMTKHANEMSTSELQRTSILLAAPALITDRSICPEDLRRGPRQCRKRYGPCFMPRRCGLAAVAQCSLTGTPPSQKS